jgi:hypothetical protein
MEQEQEATETSNMTSPQQQQNETGGNETNQTGGEGEMRLSKALLNSWVIH